MEITAALRKEIRVDIERCLQHSGAHGSEQLYEEMVGKYSLIDPDFRKNTCFVGKATIIGHEADYGKELQNAAARLKAIILNTQTTEEEEKIAEFSSLVEQIPKLRVSFVDCSGVKTIYNVAAFTQWREKIKFAVRDMRQDATTQELLTQIDSFNGYTDSEMFEAVATKCQIINNHADRYFNYPGRNKNAFTGNKVFIVHGHDTEAKTSVARFVEKLGFEAIILHEQPDKGKTIIEKLESYTEEVAFAVILYTDCDVGRAKDSPVEKEQARARQNVVFEHGLFIGSLGRERVCALVKGKIEKPGDIDGVVYVALDDAGAWKLDLCKNMKAAGLEVDMNKLIS